MACSPVGLFRLMDRKLSQVGAKVRGRLPGQTEIFSGSFSTASVVHSDCEDHVHFHTVDFSFRTNEPDLFVLSPFLLSRGLWFVDVIFVSLGKKITKIKKN